MFKSVIDIILALITGLKDILIFLLCVFLILLIPFTLVFLYFMFYFRFIKKMKIPKREIEPTYKKEGIIKRLFWDFPRQIALDRFTLNPDQYRDTGIFMFEGEQRSGKTIGAVHYIYRQLQKYPMAKFSSNIDVKGQSALLENLADVVYSDNGIYGQLNLIDEVQNWSSSTESKYVPAEFLGEICMQGKQRKALILTTQRFSNVSKALRIQTTWVFKPITIMGCLTIMRRYKPDVDSEGVINKMRLTEVYFFIQTPELRESYDTYEKVKRLADKGFNPPTPA